MKFDDEDMWFGVQRHHWRITAPVKWLAAIALIGWGASYPAAYIADCAEHAGVWACGGAWVYGLW